MSRKLISIFHVPSIQAVWSMAGCAWSITSYHRPDCFYGCMTEIP